MSYTQEYPVLADLPRIKNHNQLPVGVVIIGECLKTTPSRDKLFTLVTQSSHLSILVSYVMNLKTGDQYCCDQFDFPLKTLSWFPKALVEFRKSPSEGGLRAGAMTSADDNVGGEMLCIERTTDGYTITNWSRNDHDRFSNNYRPIEISLASNFLYDQGFLELLKNLGDRYERGLL